MTGRVELGCLMPAIGSRNGHCKGATRTTENDPNRSSTARPKARLSSPIRPMIVAACALRKADHVEKRDPRSTDKKTLRNTELDKNARLAKRTSTQTKKGPGGILFFHVLRKKWPAPRHAASRFGQTTSVVSSCQPMARATPIADWAGGRLSAVPRGPDLCLIFGPLMGHDEPKTLPWANASILSIIADAEQLS